MTVGNPQTYPKAGDISALNGGVLRRILIKGIIINRFRGGAQPVCGWRETVGGICEDSGAGRHSLSAADWG